MAIHGAHRPRGEPLRRPPEVAYPLRHVIGFDLTRKCQLPIHSNSVVLALSCVCKALICVQNAQMHRKLTANDLCVLTGCTRDQLRGLLAKLPMYARRDAQERVANKYTTHDLVLVLICCLLEGRFGLRREAVVELAPGVEQALARPSVADASGWLLLSVQPSQVRRVERPEDLSDGIVMSLDPVFEQVHHYLVPGGNTRQSVQGVLALGPVALGASNEDRGQVKKAGRGRR